MFVKHHLLNVLIASNLNIWKSGETELKIKDTYIECIEWYAQIVIVIFLEDGT